MSKTRKTTIRIDERLMDQIKTDALGAKKSQNAIIHAIIKHHYAAHTYEQKELELEDGSIYRTCTCPGWQWHHHCKHVKFLEKKAAGEKVLGEVNNHQGQSAFPMSAAHDSMDKLYTLPEFIAAQRVAEGNRVN